MFDFYLLKNIFFNTKIHQQYSIVFLERVDVPWVSKSFDTVTFFEAGLQIHRIHTKFGGFGPSNENTTLPKKFCEILKTREAPSSFVALGEI